MQNRTTNSAPETSAEVRVIKYRGHIRNWKSLCEELMVDPALSRELREQELLVKAYQRWGTDVGNHLCGMFAFALQDHNKIFAVRDHFGTKPFYYYLTEQKELLCGTYIREILSQPGFCKKFNEEMLQIYLTLTYVGGEDTFFKGLKKLMPGCYLIYEEGAVETHAYWEPEFKTDASKSVEEYAEEIHETLKGILEELDEDEAESFLSSGVDSSYIAAMSNAKCVHTCGYENQQYDESELAAQTAELLEKDFDRYQVIPEEYFAEIPYFCENTEQPLGDASAIVFSIACRNIAKDVKVCYSGEGADEFFGGYRMYGNAERYKEHLQEFYVGNTMIMNEEDKRELLLNYKEGVLPIHLVKDLYEEMGDLDPLSKMIRVDMALWLEGDIFLNVDKMSTACGLEVRMPVTDPRIFEIASRMPTEYKVTDTENKVAFRRAASKVLPEEIAYRKKIGFVVPIRYWLADERYNADVRAKLFGESSAKFFHQEQLKKLFDAYTGGESDLWRKIWTIYIFLVWYEIYFN